MALDSWLCLFYNTWTRGCVWVAVWTCLLPKAIWWAPRPLHYNFLFPVQSSLLILLKTPWYFMYQFIILGFLMAQR